MPEVDLGFAEKCPSWKLESRFFPSKIGGAPAWLNLAELPNPDQLSCSKCNHQLKFLCQIYAPVNEKSDCFHRTIFVFFCSSAECSNVNRGSFKVFRCQLPRENTHYPSEPCPETESANSDLTPEKFGISLCAVCGVKGPFSCSQCKKVHYCSKEHQRLDWKGSHKQACKTGQQSSVKSEFLLPEFEIVIEPDNYSDSEASNSDSEDDGKTEVNQELFRKMMEEGKAGTLSDAKNVDDDLKQMALGKEDKQLSKFKSIVKRCPEQILRYQLDGSPLWISDKDVPQPEDILKCTECHGERVFEFQILPQMLNHMKWDQLKEESIDWGVLAVYTCQNNCVTGPAYKEEFLWRQALR